MPRRERRERVAKPALPLAGSTSSASSVVFLLLARLWPLLRRAPEALVLTKRMLNGYARAARTAEVGLLDAHLLSAHLGLAQNGQSAPPPAPVRS